MKLYIDIFIAFLRCGIFGFGGGQATVPLIQEEVVETFKWLTIEEFTDALALVNSLPGPITTKMAALVGYKVGGLSGSIVGIVGIIIPSTLAVIILINVYLKFKDTPWLQGMMRGVRPVVVVLVIKVVLMMGRKSFPNLQTIIIAGIAAILVIKFDVHPIILIVSALIYGGIFLA